MPYCSGAAYSHKLRLRYATGYSSTSLSPTTINVNSSHTNIRM